MIDSRALVARLNPLRAFDSAALAVSGGCDSMALMALTAQAKGSGADFPRIVVYAVDHGLRPESAEECRQVTAKAAAYGFSSRVLQWRGPKPTANLQAAARDARYRLLCEAAAQDGVRALVTAHHLDDQAETLLLRLARGSGLRGLAAMRASSAIGDLPLLRPFLEVPRQALEAFLLEAGVDWIDDPSNESSRFDRVRVRKLMPALGELGLTAERIGLAARGLDRARVAIDHYARKAAACTVQFHMSGFAALNWETLRKEPDEVTLRVVGELIQAVACASHPPGLAALERLASDLDTGTVGRTLGDCAFEQGSAEIWVYREAGRAGFSEAEVKPGANIVWDRRFHVSLSSEVHGAARVRALGQDGRRLYRDRFASSVPDRAIETVPAV
ncbi:MAG: tRNA lysidine(34) synthetase TilS, partial [Pseudomonadota bacterium]